MDLKEAAGKIICDDDFIYLKRYDFSLKKLLERYPDGVPTHTIAQALMMEEEEVEELYQIVIEKLRKRML